MSTPLWVSEAAFVDLLCVHGAREEAEAFRPFGNCHALMQDLHVARTRVTRDELPELKVSLNLNFTRVPLWLTRASHCEIVRKYGGPTQEKAERIWLHARDLLWDLDYTRLGWNAEGEDYVKFFLAMT